MACKLLFWYEDRTIGEHYMNLVRWCAYFGVEPIVIDNVGHFGKGPGPGRTTAYQTFQEARAALSDHQWVFLHSGAATFLDEYTHPDQDQDAVYVLGSDVTGFGDNTEPDLQELGDTVRLRKADEIYAFQVVPMLLYDRALYHAGRRI